MKGPSFITIRPRNGGHPLRFPDTRHGGMPHWTLYLWKRDFWTDGVKNSHEIAEHGIYDNPIDSVPFWIGDCEIISPEDLEKTEVMVIHDHDNGSDTSAKSIRFSDRGVPTIAGNTGITPDMLPCPWAYRKYKSALEAGMGDTPGREMYLRLRIWFEANDALRADSSKQLQPEDLENLDRLAELYEKMYSGEALLRAGLGMVAREASGSILTPRGLKERVEFSTLPQKAHTPLLKMRPIKHRRNHRPNTFKHHITI